MAWQQLFKESIQLLQESKYFDGVMKINSCMELFETEVGSSDSKILREPDDFLAEFMPKMSPEQKSAALKMFVAQGELLMGLGASKRAAIEHTNAATLKPDGEIENAACAKPDGEETYDKNAEFESESGTKLGQDADNKIPCTILTGLMASGKTALVRHILSANRGKHIAVIENGSRQAGINDNLARGASMAGAENIMKMNKDDGCYAMRIVHSLKKLIRNSKKNGKPPDGVLIETSGLSDPAPLAQKFFADDFLQQHMRLDGILTLVDAKHIIHHLEDEKPEGVQNVNMKHTAFADRVLLSKSIDSVEAPIEIDLVGDESELVIVENVAVKQIAFADRILLSRCDLVDDESELEQVEKRIRAINDRVPIKRTTSSDVEMDFILGIHGFSWDDGTAMDDAFLEDSYDHQHNSHANSVYIDIPGEGVQETLNEWMCWLLEEKGMDLFRSKGVLAVKGMNEKFIFQAIHKLFNSSQEAPWKEGEERRCKMLFIGRNLNREELTSGFLKCMAKP